MNCTDPTQDKLHTTIAIRHLTAPHKYTSTDSHQTRRLNQQQHTQTSNNWLKIYEANGPACAVVISAHGVATHHPTTPHKGHVQDTAAARRVPPSMSLTHSALSSNTTDSVGTPSAAYMAVSSEKITSLKWNCNTQQGGETCELAWGQSIQDAVRRRRIR
jgi:hypothetical protein